MIGPSEHIHLDKYLNEADIDFDQKTWEFVVYYGPARVRVGTNRDEEQMDYVALQMPPTQYWEMALTMLTHIHSADSLGFKTPFSRSNGSMIARLYERLTKASRRRYEQASAHGEFGPFTEPEIAYRQGVYDALKALQNELQS